MIETDYTFGKIKNVMRTRLKTASIPNVYFHRGFN